MWIPENVITWIVPFVKKYYISLLFMANSNYKAIQTRIEAIFDEYEEELKLIIKKWIEKQVPDKFKSFFNLLLDWNLLKNIEVVENQVNKTPLWDIIYKYFTSNKEFIKIDKEITINLKSFRETFDNQISLYLNQKSINEKLLKKEKENAVKFMRDWVKKFENLAVKQIKQFKNDIEPKLLFEAQLPLTKLELEEMNKSILKLEKDISKWVNNEFYNNLIDLTDRIFDEIIWIIKI